MNNTKKYIGNEAIMVSTEFMKEIFENNIEKGHTKWTHVEGPIERSPDSKLYITRNKNSEVDTSVIGDGSYTKTTLH